MPYLRRTHLPVILAICALSLCALTTGALAQSVLINGVRLVTPHPPVTKGGSILLPMRDVFEALSSEVKWREADQRILATRGTTSIELWIGRTTAIVNGEGRALPVAPVLLAGSTYVPLRFPAEAFGGEVKWDAGSRTAFIEIPPLQAPPTQPPTTQPPATQPPPTQPPATQQPPATEQPPVVQQPATVEGTVLQVVTAPAGVVLQSAETGGLQAVQIGPNTVITRGPEGGEAQASALTEVRPGDYAQAVLPPGGGNVAASLSLRYGLAGGKIVAIAGNTLVLEDGSAFRLAENVRLTDPAGQPLTMPLTAITPNTAGQVLYEPHSRMVYELRVQPPAPAPQPPQQPQILSIGLLNNRTVFRRGDVLELQLRGTPGGQATASIQLLAEDVPLVEREPGVYRGRYTVETREDWRGLALRGDLRVGEAEAETAVAPERLLIDNTPPRITGVAPADASETANTSPIIRVAVEPDENAPLDRAGSRLWVNGREVTGAAEMYADELDYVARDLRPGTVSVRALIRDLAGNEATADWAFRIVRADDNPVLSVFQEEPATSVAGNVLRVIMQVANPGGVASFNLGDVRINLPMQRRGNTDVYEGLYTLQPGDRLLDVPLTVNYRDPQGRRGVLASTTRLHLDTTLPAALRLLQPTEGAEAGDVITANGEAPPNSSVRVTIGYSLRKQFTITGQLWQGTLVASAQGLWRTPQVGSSLGALGRADQYTVQAELLDDDGRTVARQQVRLKPKQQGQPVTIEGTVTKVSQTEPGVTIAPAEGGAQVVLVGPKTSVTRNEAGAPATAALLADLRLGDYARATGVPGETASSLAVTYGKAQGKVASLAGNLLSLDDGSRYTLSPGARLEDAAGRPLPATGVVKGATVELTYQPRSRVAYELRVTALPDQAEAPRIDSLVLLNKGSYFKRGDTLNVQLKGTPAGKATATIGRLVTDLPLPEVRPGVYQAAYTVLARQNLRSQPLSGKLTVGAAEAPAVTSPARIVIDNTAPAFTGTIPADGASLANDTPMVELRYESTGGAPIDTAASHFTVAGKDVVEDVHVADDRLVYLAQRLPAGPVAVKAEIHDAAGNVAATEWSFTVAPVADNPLRGVFHDAYSTLVAGSILTVTARPARPGGTATFSLGKLAVNVPMKRKGEGEFYKGTYVVREGDEVKGALVSVSYRDPAGAEGSMEATGPVDIDTDLPAEFKITQPADKSAVADFITVTGQAPPDSRIRVTVSYANAPGGAQAAVTGQLWRGTLITNARGVWQTPEIGSSLGNAGRADRYDILAELLDAEQKPIQQRKLELHR